MKKCPKCGIQLPDDTNFCTNCGTKLTNDSSISNQNESHVLTNDSSLNNKFQNQQHDNSQQNNSKQDNSQQNQNIINTEKTKQIANNYWKWLVQSWIKPTNTKTPSSKWFGIISIVLEIFLLCASFFALMQRIISYINSFSDSVAEDITSMLNALHLSIFGVSFECFIIFLIVNAAVIGIVYGINCWVFKEKENIWNFINRFAHYTNIILIINVILFLLCLITNFCPMMYAFILFGIFIYGLGMSETILVRQGTQRLDRMYGAIVVGLVLLIAIAVIFSIAGNEVLLIFRALTAW